MASIFTVTAPFKVLLPNGVYSPRKTTLTKGSSRELQWMRVLCNLATSTTSFTEYSRAFISLMMAKPILIMQLRPEDVTADSEYACFLKYGQMKAGDTRRIRIESNGIPDDIVLDDYSAIIVGGSPFDISTPEHRKPGIQKKIEADFNRLLEQVVSRDFPFFGACSGNGLLGRYLGTPITTKYREAVGCVTLNITEAGKMDKLLAGLPEQIDVLLGHKEACDTTPEGAALLMTGSDCPVQMFRVGENVYATQFHPEGDPGEFILRINTYANHGYFEPREAEALIKAVTGKATPHAQDILRRFVQRYSD